MRRLRIVLALVLIVGGALAAGCTKAQAKVVPDPPALEVPMPPPRNVEATEQPEPPPVIAVPEEPAAPAAPPRPRPAPANAQRPETRPEPPRTEAPATPEPQRPADETRAPSDTLQTTPAVRQAQVERTIRDTLTRASTNLNSVDYRALNADARTQYDQAKRFISQAQDALREKNLVFAANLAEKANTLASQLSGR